jgi:hypothetical protein
MLFMGYVLKICLDACFNNAKNWKGIWEKAGKVNSIKPYTTKEENSC